MFLNQTNENQCCHLDHFESFVQNLIKPNTSTVMTLKYAIILMEIEVNNNDWDPVQSRNM